MFFLFKKQDPFIAWMERINQENQPGPDINAFHFGIFDDGSILYLAGSKRYGKDEEWQEWQSYPPDFLPKEKDFILKNQFGRLYNDNEWKDQLNKVEYLIKEFIKSDKFKNHFISKGKAITLGFNGGDIIWLVKKPV